MALRSQDMPAGPAAEIDDIAVRLETAFNAADAVALASLYSETAILMPPNEPMVSGRREIRAWFERALEGLESVQIVPIESNCIGDRAFQVGTFTTSRKGAETASSAEGAVVRAQTGKYVLLLTGSVGHWKIQYDIWSLDQPIG